MAAEDPRSPAARRFAAVVADVYELAGELERCSERLHEPVIVAQRSTIAGCGDVVEKEAHRDGLERLPAIEWVAVICREEREIVGLKIGEQIDRRRKAAIDRKNWAFFDAGEFKSSRLLIQYDGPVFKKSATG